MYELDVIGCYGEGKDNGVGFGRSLKKSNIRLAVEPYSPAHMYQSNLKRTKLISSLHVSIYIEGNTVFFIDEGSSKGTQLNNNPIQKHIAYALNNHDRLVIANVLQLKAHIFRKDGQPQAILFTRENNKSLLGHLVVFGAVGLWLSRLKNPEEPLLWEQIIDLRMIRDQQAPLSLINVEDDQGNTKVSVCNTAQRDVKLKGEHFRIGEYVPLSKSIEIDSIELGRITVHEIK